MQVFRVDGLIPGPIAAQIGRICLQWSILELKVEEAIWTLAGLTRKEGRLLTARENLEPRLKRLKKLAKEKLPADRLENIQDIITEIKRVGKLRHWAVHGLHGVDAHGKLHSVSYRNDVKGLALEISDQSLRKVRSAIMAVTRRLERAPLLQEPDRRNTS